MFGTPSMAPSRHMITVKFIIFIKLSSFFIQISSFLMQNSSFSIQNSSFLLTNHAEAACAILLVCSVPNHGIADCQTQSVFK